MGKTPLRNQLFLPDRLPSLASTTHPQFHDRSGNEPVYISSLLGPPPELRIQIWRNVLPNRVGPALYFFKTGHPYVSVTIDLELRFHRDLLPWAGSRCR